MIDRRMWVLLMLVLIFTASPARAEEQDGLPPLGTAVEQEGAVRSDQEDLLSLEPVETVVSVIFFFF